MPVEFCYRKLKKGRIKTTSAGDARGIGKPEREERKTRTTKGKITKKSENIQGQCQMRRKEGGVTSMDVVILIETQKTNSMLCRDGLGWVW